MVTTEAGMGPIDLLESVGEPSRRQLTGREPAAEIGKSSRDRRKGDADQGNLASVPALLRRGRATPARIRSIDMLHSSQQKLRSSSLVGSALHFQDDFQLDR